MPRLKDATRERILGAAVEEFARRGLAGGRMDRIAEAAGVNIKSVYLAYSDKRELFGAAVTHVLGQVGTAVPFTPEDLAGWAGRFFDEITVGDAAHRLNLWRMLEAPDVGPDDRTSWSAAVAEISRRRPAAAVPSDDLVIMIPAMAAAWLTTSRDLADAATVSDDEPRRRRFRDSLVAAVRLLDRAEPQNLPRDGRSLPSSSGMQRREGDFEVQ